MQPTEQELTVAVDAAARANWDVERRLMAKLGQIAPVFDSLPAADRHLLRGRVLDVIRATLAALPDRAEAERRRIGTYTLVGDGDGCVHHNTCAVADLHDVDANCTCGLEELLERLREVDPL